MVKRSRKKRRGLGSSAATHTAEAARAARDIEYAAATLVNKARHGQCTVATVEYAKMQQAIGRFDAHNHSGGKAWKPETAIREASREYNDYCVSESTHARTVSGRRRRR